MKRLTSRDNPLYKELKLLASSSQARRKSQRSLLDGVHLAQAYLDHVGMPAVCVVREEAAGGAEVAGVIQRCQAGGAPCVVLSEALYGGLSQVEEGVGLLFVVDTPESNAPAVLTAASVLIDRLQDPGNLGSILRSAAAAGIRNIYCSTGTVFAWSPKVLRAGMGAHFSLRIREQADLRDLISSSEVPVVATSSHAEQTIFEMDLRRPVAWLFGNEGQGVSPELMDAVSIRAGIPHAGPVESLNVAAAAAVCLFEQLRQSRSGGTTS